MLRPAARDATQTQPNLLLGDGVALVRLNFRKGNGPERRQAGNGSDTLCAPSSSNFPGAPHMAALVARPLPQPVSARRYDRAFYSSIAIAMALTALVGFGPTYYFKAFGQGPMATRRAGVAAQDPESARRRSW